MASRKGNPFLLLGLVFTLGNYFCQATTLGATLGFLLATSKRAQQVESCHGNMRIAECGLLGHIVPNKWTNITTGAFKLAHSNQYAKVRLRHERINPHPPTQPHSFSLFFILQLHQTARCHAPGLLQDAGSELLSNRANHTPTISSLGLCEKVWVLLPGARGRKTQQRNSFSKR